ncbi:DUF3383 domain-containing protein [Glaesserella parasuis]|uniref:DUF3383 domain-containing protein n=1 Tax=Glaesserella parasuis TaxID=738 RepID=UPI0003AC38AD|nr:DUF3383 domain-containing protein [Glaesserella parasuis]ATW45303.1 phage tail protein [Glaesserella parasuis str. Nagasaki]EPZ98528.1 hypothetical protein HPSNAG_2359 [Glaesserella parasuis str. Nagasaki]EYE72704.1 hypothetical protein HPNK_02988 [Glaesserella parasuis str. Nagasaki]MDP0069707.1 DUF3383 domain-containing protein [Glaesserella parasuis]MDP0245645.1 DUF3383 domain-containing protein [Glaesserella parasuis]
MFQSIPASQIVNVNPSVLSSGGSPLSMNAVFLSENANLPTGRAVSFATADSVGEYFGFTSAEYQAAAVYFKGFDGSTIKPGTLIFFAYNKAIEGAFLLGASVKSLSLNELKKINGTLSVIIDGSEKKADSLNLSGAKSFSNAAELIGTALGSVTVTFDSQLQAFKVASSTTGTTSTIAFATGATADALGLSENAGATLSQGSNTTTPTETMQAVIGSTLNWATFTTITEPTLEEKLEFAKWSNNQNQRFLYVGWGKEATATQTGDTTSFGAKLKESEYSGATAVYGGLDKAAFLCGTVASIDFTEKQGRITLKFKGQSGLTADVTDATIAKNLEDNGYNYYGAWATDNDRFLFLSPGQISGEWKWIDAYINQIRLNSQLQLAIITLLTSAKSVPYNDIGIALQRAACNDPINEALNFGSIQVGVSLSEQQKAIINNYTGVDAASQVEAQGYYLYIGKATAQTRGNRESFPMKLFYTDGGSLHSVNLASINVQ